MFINNKNYMTRSEAAKYCGLSLRTIDRFREDGRLEYVQLNPNGKVFVAQSELDALYKRSTRSRSRSRKVS